MSSKHFMFASSRVVRSTNLWIPTSQLIRTRNMFMATSINLQTVTCLTPRNLQLRCSPRHKLNPIHTRTASMSFSNTDTGGKTADPYTAKNLQDPSLKEKVEDLVHFIDKSKFCMMTTKTSDGLLASRCMALAAKEGNGVDLIFHANSESGKTDDLQANPEVNLGFLTSSGEWASISGQASIETDREKVHKYYSPALKAWVGDLGDGKHDGGPDDPRIVVIKVKSKTVQYAVSRKTAIGSVIDIAKGAITGEAPTINKLRHINESELQQWRS